MTFGTQTDENMEMLGSADGSVCLVFTRCQRVALSSSTSSVVCRFILAVCVCVSGGAFNVSVNFLCCCCVTAF